MHTRTRRRLVQAFDRRLQRGLPHKGQRPGHHLVKHDAERVDIRGGRDRTALNLLGGHVSRRTRYLVLRRQRHRQAGALILRAPPRQTEIRDDGAHLFFFASRLHEHDVVALEVPVHDPNAVRGRQAGGHLTNDRQDLRRGEPSVPPELVGQRLAVQQLHRENHDLAGRSVTRSRVSMPEDIVDTTDVRVRHLSRQVHLALEQQDRTLVSGDVRQDGLERDPLAQFKILRLVELAHAAFRKVADDAEAERDDVASSKHRGPRRPSLNHSGAGRVVIGPAERRGRWNGLELAVKQALDPEMRIDARDHLLRLDGLRDEIHRAGFESPHFVLRVVERGQEDHRRVPGFGIVLETAARLVAVDARHDDIEQDDQRLRAARNLQRLFAIAGHEEAVARAPERLAQDVQVRGIVIDQEDPAGLIRGDWCELMVHRPNLRRPDRGQTAPGGSARG